MTGHLPERRTWLCSTCGAEWPCRPRRAALIAEYAEAPTSLVLVMNASLIEAGDDMPDVPAGVLNARFLGWLWAPRGTGLSGP